MREIRKIVWATDGSKESEDALLYARFFAERFNSEIIGVHVIEMPERLLYDYLKDPESEHYGWLKKAEGDYAEKLAAIADELTGQGLSFRGEILKGEPYREIVGFATNQKAGLIVLGKRGLGLLDQMLVGSTNLTILRESTIPVLSVGKHSEKSKVNIGKILVPIDIEEKVDSAIDFAVDVADRIQANISALYVFKLSIYDYFDYGIHADLMEVLIKDASKELERRIEDISLRRGIPEKAGTSFGISAEMIRRLNPSLAIIDYASSKNADLIIINTHGRKGLKGFALGSVTEKVVQQSPCAVLTLRPQG